MGNPVIFNGSRAKFLTDKAFLKSGQPLDYNGEINWIANNNALSDTTGWATYADAAAATPVDGTGGSPTVTFTRSTSSPIRGSADFLITKDAANRQGQGASYAFTIDSADCSKLCKISFDSKVSAAFVAADVAVYVYDVTNATLITPSSVGIPAVTTNGAFNEINFVTSTSLSYRLIFHVASTNASAYTVNINNVLAGPGRTTSGAIVGMWTAYTPTWSQVTGTAPVLNNGTITGYSRRVGEQSEITILLTTGNTTTYGDGTDGWTFSIPAGLTITAAMSSSRNHYGTALARVTASNNEYIGLVRPVTTSTVYVSPEGGGAANSWKSSVPATWAATTANQFVSMKFSVPVNEYAGGGSVGQNFIEYVSFGGTWDADSSVTTYGIDGAPTGGALTAARTKTLTTQYPLQADSVALVQFQETGTTNWSTVPANAVQYFQTQNSVTYGISVGSMSGSTVVLNVGQYRRNISTTWGGTGTAWPSDTKIRVAIFRSGAPIGFGIATQTQSGLVSTDAQTLAGIKAFTSGVKLKDTGAGSDTMSHYETGTFTPNLRADGSNPTITYVTQTGLFTRVGRVVFYQMYIEWSAGSGGTGNAYIDNLPYSSNASAARPVPSVLPSNINITNGTVLSGQMPSGGNFLFLNEQGDALSLASVGVTALYGGSFNKSIYITGFYQT